MTTLTARIRPTSRSARSVLESVGVALRERELAGALGNESSTGASGLGAMMLTELPGELVINVSGTADADAAMFRRALSQQVRYAAGSPSAAAQLVITWAERPPLHSGATV